MSAWWDPRGWGNPISWASDQLDSKDKAYKLQKEETRKIAQKAQLICIIGGIIVAADVLRARSINLLVDIPIAYFLYNGFRVGQNLETIAQNPNHYSSFFGWGTVVGNNEIDKGRVRECFIKNTFYFDYFVDLILDRLTKKK